MVDDEHRFDLTKLISFANLAAQVDCCLTRFEAVSGHFFRFHFWLESFKPLLASIRDFYMVVVFLQLLRPHTLVSQSSEKSAEC